VAVSVPGLLRCCRPDLDAAAHGAWCLPALSDGYLKRDRADTHLIETLAEVQVPEFGVA